ncbi:PH domain-containing protein [Aureliella helgolandensis]|nr:PH domain-containing protein [Aureliella helgolandensis]
MRYRFDDTGVSMQWGVLFRQEVYLTYRRIQDIHLTRNLLQRWMGLAKISLQTASGSSQSEMTIEGILEVDELRTFLYSKMRGSKNEHPQSQHAHESSPSAMPAPSAIPQAAQCLSSESNSLRATRALEEIRDALQVLVAKQKGENS